MSIFSGCHGSSTLTTSVLQHYPARASSPEHLRWAHSTTPALFESGHMVGACTHTPFTAASMLCNVHMRTHRDKYNMQDTLNILIPVTRFRQGQIWIEEEQGPDLSPGGQHRGRKHVVKLPGIEFSPFIQHGTCPWKSDRIVLSAYTTHKADEISNKDKILLRTLGFNLQHLSKR